MEDLSGLGQFSGVFLGRRVLVTGHTGFKGSWLVTWLLQLGAQVAGYSLNIPSTPSNFELINLKGRIRHYSGDVRDRSALRAAIDDFQPEIVFHLAAQALVRRSYADPAGTFETNVMGMVNLLECIRLRPSIQVAVLITSDKAYRNDEWCWGYRETDVLAGKDPYSGSKSCADLVAHSYFHSFFLNSATRLAITRAGNVIGGGDWADDRIIPDCIRAWVGGISVAIRSPRATRPWQHVLEPLGGYLLLAARLWQRQPRITGEAFNFGPDARVNHTVAQMLDEMQAHWPGSAWHAPEGCEALGHEATLLKLSCDKALSHLQWQAVLDFRETVAFTADWYRAWTLGQQDMYALTVEQIRRYSQLVGERGGKWIN
jgi:CDP-glucose 4,6-dehydratase